MIHKISRGFLTLAFVKIMKKDISISPPEKAILKKAEKPRFTLIKGGKQGEEKKKLKLLKFTNPDKLPPAA
jgi:hypothetical protein